MEKLLTIKEACDMLNVSKSTLQRWDREGKFSAVRTAGGHRRYKQSEVEAMQDSDADISYGKLYEYLCDAQYVADVLGDENAQEILEIRERVGKKILNNYAKI